VLREQGERLVDAVDAAIPGWMARCLGAAVDDAGVAAVVDQVRADVVPRLRALLARDVDDQRENPLTILRSAVRFPTGSLRDAGVRPSPRPGFDAEHFPGDDYGLTPMTWRDIDESLHEPGLLWGALKARASMARHRSS